MRSNIFELDILEVVVEYLLSSSNIREGDMDSLVESPCPLDGWVQTLFEVGCSNHYDVICLLESIHLCEELIQSCIAMVLSVRCVSVPSYGVYFVDKYYSRGALTGLAEEFLDST